MLVREISKNAKERILISLDKYMGRDICNVRVCFEAEPGVWVPSRKGIAFNVMLLTEIIQGLKAAEKNVKQQQK